MNWKGQGRRRYSVVCIVTLVLAARFAVRVPAGTRDFSSHRNVQTGSGAHPVRPSSYPGAKLPGREVGHSLPSSAFMAFTWRTLSVLSLSRNYRVILSIRKILNQSFRLLHMSCIYLWFIERRVCCVWLYRVIQEERSVFWEVLVSIIVRRKQFIWTCVWLWMVPRWSCRHNSVIFLFVELDELLARILDAATRMKKREYQLRRTTHDLRTRVAKCCDVDVTIFEHLLWTLINLSFLCNKFVI